MVAIYQVDFMYQHTCFRGARDFPISVTVEFFEVGRNSIADMGNFRLKIFGKGLQIIITVLNGSFTFDQMLNQQT